MEGFLSSQCHMTKRCCWKFRNTSPRSPLNRPTSATPSTPRCIAGFYRSAPRRSVGKGKNHASVVFLTGAGKRAFCAGIKGTCGPCCKPSHAIAVRKYRKIRAGMAKCFAHSGVFRRPHDRRRETARYRRIRRGSPVGLGLVPCIAHFGRIFTIAAPPERQTVRPTTTDGKIIGFLQPIV